MNLKNKMRVSYKVYSVSYSFVHERSGPRLSWV